MTEERKFPESYPCPCCNLCIHELTSDIYECKNHHKFSLSLDNKEKKRVLTVLQGCDNHKKGEKCIVDAIWPADIPGLKGIFGI